MSAESMKVRFGTVPTAILFVAAMFCYSRPAPSPALVNVSSRRVAPLLYSLIPRGMPEKGKLQKPLAVNGIKLGDSYGRVLKILGKPRKEKRTFESEVPVSGTEWGRSIEYDGAVIELVSGRRSGPFHIVSIAISGKQWKLSHGLRIGMSESEVIKALGPAYESNPSLSGQTTTLSYVNSDGDGWASFYFSQEHLKTVQWSFDLS